MDNKKSAELMVKEIKDKAQQEADSILQKAKEKADIRIKLAQGEIKRYLEERQKDTEAKKEIIRKRLLSTVGLETRRIITKAKEDVISRVLERVKEKGREFRQKKKEYLQWLERAIIEGVLAIANANLISIKSGLGKSVKIAASKLDSEIITEKFIEKIQDKIKNTYGLDISIKIAFDAENKDTGVIIKSADEKAVFYNIFSSRMQRQKNILRLVIYKEIFPDA